ncbi:gametocyte-specific factor 1 [Grus americana]|uniref:gametocyte-specific factor 1 n=1 Tax=Grus americana TaxID=9117 RepID=UPI0024083C6A|nr:gametocyte-specific factor 1 [Grus americana]
MDPEALVQCPYDKSHQVRVSRLPYHLVKCQRNNPRVARTLATCPFNARHRVPQAELRSHVISCPDKRQPDLPHEMGAPLNNGLKQPEVPTAWQGPPCQEDWEAELEDLEDPPPFILHVRTNDLLLPCDSSAPAAPTSHSGSKGATGHPAHPLAPPAPPSRRPQPPLNSGSDVNSDEEDDRDRTGSRCLRVRGDPTEPPPRREMRRPTDLGRSMRRIGISLQRILPGLKSPSPRGARSSAAVPASPPTFFPPRAALPVAACPCLQVESHPNPFLLQQFHVCFEPCQQRPCNTCREFFLGGWIRPAHWDSSLPLRFGSRYRLGDGSCPGAGISTGGRAPQGERDSLRQENRWKNNNCPETAGPGEGLSSGRPPRRRTSTKIVVSGLKSHPVIDSGLSQPRFGVVYSISGR